jgi:hypothetical protein
MKLPYDPAIPLLGIYLNECKSVYNKSIGTHMIIAWLWIQPRCPTTDEGTKHFSDHKIRFIPKSNKIQQNTNTEITQPHMDTNGIQFYLKQQTKINSKWNHRPTPESTKFLGESIGESLSVLEINKNSSYLAWISSSN